MKKNLKLILKILLRITNISSYHVFEKILNVLQRHAPIKNKTVRANHASYVTKTMTKADKNRATTWVL